MKVAVVEKPRFFRCDCGEQFILGVWKLIEKDGVTVVRFLQNHHNFYCCPFCGGRMSQKDMVLEP